MSAELRAIATGQSSRPVATRIIRGDLLVQRQVRSLCDHAAPLPRTGAVLPP